VGLLKKSELCKKRFMDFTTDLLSLFLPQVLVDYFQLINHRKEGEILHLYFEESIDKPKEFSDLKLHSKGFHKQITIQDFPLRGVEVYLHIRRRRWIDVATNKVVERDWSLVAQGTRMTTEFSAFFKRN
jgi:hypothetical protein